MIAQQQNIFAAGKIQLQNQLLSFIDFNSSNQQTFLFKKK